MEIIILTYPLIINNIFYSSFNLTRKCLNCSSSLSSFPKKNSSICSTNGTAFCNISSPFLFKVTAFTLVSFECSFYYSIILPDFYSIFRSLIHFIPWFCFKYFMECIYIFQSSIYTEYIW